ncbi:MAG TPA: hypothetical protein VI136_20125 [Verrucomicrobiae bacterium]
MRIRTGLLVILLGTPAHAQLPAFPGADGAAANVAGGRGGLVYHVTKLDRNFSDTAAGTLRYGLSDANFPAGVPRTIVFDVGGTFWLGRYGAERGHDNGWDTQSRLSIGSNLTLAGQTAPGGVFIMGGVVKIGGTNVILRHVTIAPGYGLRNFAKPEDGVYPTPGDFPDSYVYDALDVSGQNVMIDHVTAVYATDETFSVNELAHNVTLQNCNISQGQNYPQWDAEGGGYTGHALGSLLQAGSNFRISVLHNLYAHQKGRMPRVGSEVGTGAINDFRNNVFYNWLGTAGGGASGQPSFNNFLHNFYLAGPGGDNPVGGSNSNLVHAAGGTGIFNGASSSATRAYVSGNLKDTNKDGDPHDPVSADGSANFASTSLQAAAYDVNLGVTLTASNALRNVLRHVGARWWERGYDFTLGNTHAIRTVDERLVHETWTGAGKIMAWADDPFNPDGAEGAEWRDLLALRADTNTFAAPFTRPPGWDTDGDGMPDAWEREHGLDPNVANHNADFDNDGYTDLEEYLNDLAAWPAPGVIVFTGHTNHRFAEIHNWQVSGVAVNISGQGTVTTASRWQPSRHDTAVLSNRTTVVDAVGQHAGTLRLTNAASLAVTHGWLSIANTLEIGAACTVSVQAPGSLRITNYLVNEGTLRLAGAAMLTVGGGFTNLGRLDLITWNGAMPTGFVNLGTVLDRDAIRVESAWLKGADLELTLHGYAGHHYQLQWREALAGGDWLSAGPVVPGADGPLTLTHQGGGNATHRFYRVVVDP